MATAEEITKLIPCRTAGELLDSIRLRGPEFAGKEDLMGWLFRGHASAAWKLIATALRPGELAKVLHGDRGRPSNVQEQIFAEQAILLSFIDRTDSIGLPLPDISTEFRLSLDELLRWARTDGAPSAQHVWIQRKLYALFAMVQHSGLPTRLLDWTAHPFKAAYFAASDACEEMAKTGSGLIDGSDKLEIWAVKHSKFGLLREGAGSMIDSSIVNSVEFFPIARATNPNARAQEGSFSIIRGRWPKGGPIPQESLDAEIAGACKTTPLQLFKRFTLPLTQAATLLRELKIEGIDAATVFPNYRGAADAVRHARHWPTT